MSPGIATLLAAGCTMLAAGVALGLIEVIAEVIAGYLFDHVDDAPGRDETAPPGDAP